MRIDTALLCDWVTVREGLLHILGGGVTRIWRDEYPAPLGLCLALRVVLHPTEVNAEHQFRVLLISEDGSQVAEVEGGIGTDIPAEASALLSNFHPGEEVAIPMPLPMTGIPVQGPGAYSFELLIDGVHQASVPFRAELGSSSA